MHFLNYRSSPACTDACGGLHVGRREKEDEKVRSVAAMKLHASIKLLYGS
jgi:hypothetical protein